MPEQRIRARSPHDSTPSFLFTRREWHHVANALQLSPRELEIIHAVFNDLKEVAIAQRLGISPHTVHTYLERVFRKLGVNSRVQVVVRIVAELRHLERPLEPDLMPEPAALLPIPSAFQPFELGG